MSSYKFIRLGHNGLNNFFLIRLHACNKLLWYYFGQYTVINHRYLLQKTNQAKNNRKYANLFKDTVHFKQYICDSIVHKIFERIAGPSAGTLTRAQ